MLIVVDGMFSKWISLGNDYTHKTYRRVLKHDEKNVYEPRNTVKRYASFEHVQLQTPILFLSFP